MSQYGSVANSYQYDPIRNKLGGTSENVPNSRQRDGSLYDAQTAMLQTVSGS